MLQTRTVSLSELDSRIVGASYYPFKPDQLISNRFPYVHSFTYIASGYGQIRLGKESFTAEPHDLFYMEPGTLHSFHADPQQPMVHASVYADLLSPSSPKQKGDPKLNTYELQAIDWGQCAARASFTEGVQIPVRSKAPRNALWIDSLLEVIRLFPETGIGADILLRAHFEAFVIRYLQFITQPSPDFYDPRIAKLIRWLEEAGEDRMSIADWAPRLGISTAYLYELFRKQTGTSPQAYELRVKLDRAKTYLRETGLPVTEIARRLGFSSLHYFTRQFSKQMQETPSHYRSRFRGHD